MNKQVIMVPKGVRYISDWREYTLPQGHCIVDKGVTGCGYTEYCLRNNLNVVLCSPRKLLLENKSEQHVKDLNILYLKNDLKDFDDSREFEKRITEHIFRCKMNNISCKLLVTYDSSFRVKEVLKQLGFLQNFFFIIDEFQSIFLDSYYKAEVELDFVEALQDCPNVLYLSATPMLDKYMDRLDEFKNLPFYELDWSETGVVEQLILKRKFTTSLTKECSKIIQSYLSKKYEMIVKSDNSIAFSKEAVFYFNSIGDIIKIIKKNGITPDQVNIICADTKDNKNKLSRLSTELGYRKGQNKFIRGKIPLKGEPNKMFTFCTRSAYIGSDFYSDNARSFIFADPNISCLALDISLDLPQIVGRQREDENPFKNDITIFYRTLRGNKKLDLNEFRKIQDNRRKETRNLLTIFSKCTTCEERQGFIKKLKDSIKVSQYSDDFISISKHTNQPVYNTLIEVANERAWEVCQEDYQDKISVTRALEGISSDISDYLDDNEKIVQDFLDNHFYKTGIFKEKMELYCKFMDRYGGNQEIQSIIYYKVKDPKFREFYNFYGTKGCSARKYQEGNLYEGIIDYSKNEQLRVAIKSTFKEGQTYTLKRIKEILGNLYQNLGITSKPKATDLGNYFKLIKSKVTDQTTKKRIDCFKLCSI